MGELAGSAETTDLSYLVYLRAFETTGKLKAPWFMFANDLGLQRLRSSEQESYLAWSVHKLGTLVARGFDWRARWHDARKALGDFVKATIAAIEAGVANADSPGVDEAQLKRAARAFFDGLAPDERTRFTKVETSPIDSVVDVELCWLLIATYNGFSRIDDELLVLQEENRRDRNPGNDAGRVYLSVGLQRGA